MDTTVTVARDETGLYIEADGRRFDSDGLPDEGTEVEVHVYEGTDDCIWADVSWTGVDTPSGEGFESIPAS